MWEEKCGKKRLKEAWGISRREAGDDTKKSREKRGEEEKDIGIKKKGATGRPARI